jgi:hypothetical protein
MQYRALSFAQMHDSALVRILETLSGTRFDPGQEKITNWPWFGRVAAETL